MAENLASHRSVYRPDYLLIRSADEAVRLIALALLDDTVCARARLDDANDQEALHDFRVALRRLRSCLRTYREPLDSGVSRGLRRRLREVARATGDSRDLEVQIQWLHGWRPELDPSEVAGASQLLHRLEIRKEKADRKLRRNLDSSFAKTTAKLEARLRDYRTRLALQPPPDSAVQLISRRVQELGDALEGALAEVRSIDDVERAHATRIAAKRLRYALEPVEALVDGIAPLLKPLESLQDDLGEFHDSQVFLTALEETLSDEAQPGFAALRDRLRRRGTDAFERVRQTWLMGAADPVIRQVRDVSEAIAGQLLRQPQPPTHRVDGVQEVAR